MQEIGERLKRRRLALGWSALKVATLAEISQPHLSRIENGKGGYAAETLSKIAGALGLSLERLYSSKSNVEDAIADFRTIPVLDYVQAGRWTGLQPEDSETEMRQRITTNIECPPSTFALVIRGDSMEPRFTEGDVVVINPTIPPRPGDFVVATDESGEATFKQYRAAGVNFAGQSVFELVPLNPIYGPMRSDIQKIAIVGVMIEHRSYRQR